MGRLILVSNRLPVTVKVEGDDFAVKASSGGLVTGLRGPHESSGGTWIGWPGDVAGLSDDRRAALDRRLAAMRLAPVHLSAAEVSGYYDGFSNAVLWPLCHYLLDRIPPTSREWERYREVNEKFADAAARAWTGPEDLVWVHDYQLVLVPEMLRTRVPGARIGFFLHIPFPASEVLRILPWREQVLEGLLGADLVGFHTHTYRTHFSSSVLRIFGIPTQGDSIYAGGREVRLGVFPIGVDAAAFTAHAEDPTVRREATGIRQEARGERILLGIDRLDYTKGIPRRLLAYERMLERDARWRGKVRLVQIAVPSRDQVPSYQEYRRQVDEMVGHINGAYGTVDWTPIHYVHRSLDARQVVALYCAADAMLVTPLRDGMNLVAKEFVTCRTDEDGVLVLSEFAGAAAEMGEALQVNPYDVDAMAQAYADALEMPEEERRVRMRALRGRIAARDVHHWAQSFISSLEGERREHVGLSKREEVQSLVARLRSAERLLLLVDYDGTLVPFARAPNLAAPDRALHDLLSVLAARPGTRVHVVSGRTREVLERWLGDLRIGLHAEHGYWSRCAPGASWTPCADVSVAWMPGVRRLLDDATASTPGALVEEKSVSLAWHWRMAEPELGAERAEALWRRLEHRTAGEPVQLLRGDKVIEVRPRDVNKGCVVSQVLAEPQRPAPVILAIGDDTTDDDMFRALPPEAITVGVGFRTTLARWRLQNPRAVREFLAALVAAV